MSLDPAVVSVIVSGCVAILAVAIPMFSNLILDRQKWIRERRLSALQEIEKTTQQLLESLNDFWARNYEPSGSVLRPDLLNWRQLNSQMMSRYSAWEQALWALLKDDERATVRNIRKEILAFTDDKPEQVKYTTYILDLCNTAKTRIK
jgi:hypothetical protein